MNSVVKPELPIEPQGQGPAHRSFRDFAAAGFTSALIPILPPDAPLMPGSEHIGPKRGKVPGKYTYLKKWVGFGEWTKHITTPADLDKWGAWPGVGVGVRTGGALRLVAIDIDCEAGGVSKAIYLAAIRILGATPVRVGNAPKVLGLYALHDDDAMPGKIRLSFTLPGQPRQAVEILGEGRQFVAEGIHPKTGRPYSWFGGHPCDAGRKVTVMRLAQLEQFLTTTRALVTDAGGTLDDATVSGGASADAVDQSTLRGDPETVIAALALIPNEVSYEEWIKLSIAVKAAAGEAAYDAWHEWSMQWPDNTSEICEEKWRSFSPPFTVGATFIYECARPYGFNDAALAFTPLGPLPEGGASPQRAVIIYRPERLDEAVSATEAAVLADEGAGIVLRFADAFCTVEYAPPRTVRQVSGGDYPRMPVVRRFDRASFQERIAKSVTFMAASPHGNAENLRPVGPPDKVIDSLLARRGGEARPLTGVIEAPTLRRNGSVVTLAGYDAETGLFAAFRAADFKDMPTDPTHEDARRALKILREELVADFEFQSEEDRSVAVLCFLTAQCRRTLDDGAPIFSITAPVQASGKTALAQMICQAAYGRPAAATAYPGSEDEMGKLLLAILREGQPGVLLDNIPDGAEVNSSHLAQATTSETYAGRILGQSQSQAVPHKCDVDSHGQ
jgi:putative DNA primase/helicase